MDVSDPEWTRKRSAFDGKPWPDLDFGDVVLVNSNGPEDIRGARGYVLGWAPESDPPDVGVFIYGEERVWQLEYPMVTPTGETHRD